MPIGCDSSPLGSKILFSFHSLIRSRVLPLMRSCTLTRFLALALTIDLFEILTRSVFLSLDIFARILSLTRFTLSRSRNFCIQRSHRTPFTQNFSDNRSRDTSAFFSPSISKRHEILGWPIACFQNRRASNGARNQNKIFSRNTRLIFYSTSRYSIFTVVRSQLCQVCSSTTRNSNFERL